MRRHTSSGAPWGLVLAALAGAVVLGTSGCYTQLSPPPEVDVTQTGAQGSSTAVTTPDGEQYFPPSRTGAAYSRYPEDQLLDPFYYGSSYSIDRSSRSRGYGAYYENPWWLTPGYYQGGGGTGTATPPRDTRGGRQLWRSDPTPVLPPAPGQSSGTLGGASATPSGAASSAAGAQDSAKAQPDGKKAKKGSGRQLWR